MVMLKDWTPPFPPGQDDEANKIHRDAWHAYADQHPNSTCEQRNAYANEALHRRQAPGGLHERLTDIVHEITGTDLENEFDGAYHLTAKHRARVREIAAELLALVDEYDRLDPLTAEAK